MIEAGIRLAHYDIKESLGKGGMGEVYRANDQKLGRDVAIKILPKDFAEDRDRLARFQREAKLLASLSHPNIAAIHGLEYANDTHFLVLELVEGETLADQLARGPIPVDESLKLAAQICEALQAAHEKGVIHRDLKPANIKVTHDGVVKVLDFGLAKAGEIESSAADVLSNSPTLRTLASTPGMILGTAAYMSPEQAKGRPVDRRTDIFAFGCVLYEMLTGKRAFEGEDISDTLASVLRAEPNWAVLPKELPPTVRTLLKSCLEKDRRQRIADISTALFVIQKLPELATMQPQPTTPASLMWKLAVPVLVGVLALAIVGVLMMNRKASIPATVSRFSITLDDGQQFTSARHVLAISPDGTRIAYAANQQLYLRSISDIEARPIPGTHFPQGVSSPVFSPDGASIAFYVGGSGIRRVSLSGETPTTLCDLRAGLFGISWNADSILVGLGGQGIQRCPANGGALEQVISVKDDEVAHQPQMLPGGAVLYTLATGNSDDRWEQAKIVVQRPGSGDKKVLIDGGTDARYLPTGQLIYAHEGVLFAAPFDPATLQIGKSVRVVEGVRRSGIATNPGTAHFIVSNTGTMIYLPGPTSTTAAPRNLGLVAREGSIEILKLPPRPYEFPRFSPDGKRVVVGTYDGRDAAVWIVDLVGRAAPLHLTLTGRNRFPIWTADGDRVAFQSDREGDLGIWWHRADGSGMTERLTKAEPGEVHIPNAWSPVDHETFLFTVGKADKFSLWTYSLKTRKATPFGVESSAVPDSDFSPDGRWVAYSRRGVNGLPLRGTFLQPFPSTGETHQVVDFGAYLAWSREGKELFIFDSTTAAWNTVSVTSRPSVTFGNPAPLAFPLTAVLFAARGGNAVPRNWDVSPLDDRLIGVASVEALQPQIHVVLNWFEELRQRVPTK